MSYHIYTTNGIILKRTPFGEDSVLSHILTEDLGLIMASARAARLSASKLRSALQEYAHITLSCIKSKNGWKVTNVIEKGSFFFQYPEYSHRTMAQIATLLLKMITGESPHPEIFQTVRTGFEFLQNISEENISNFEILAVLRILHQLGYVAGGGETKYQHTQGSPMYAEVFLKDTTEWNDKLLEKVGKFKSTLVGLINKGLKESHLT